MHKVGIGLCLNIDFFDSLCTFFVRKRDISHVVFVEGVGVRRYRGGEFVIDVKNAHWKIGGYQIDSPSFNQLVGSY